MQSKKKFNKEIESKKKQRKLLMLSIFAVVALVLITGVGYTIWNAQDRQWVMRFNGERIAVDDIRYWEAAAFADLGDPEHREALLDFLITSLTILDHAERNGVVLTAEEIEDVNAFAQEQMAFFEQTGIVPMVSFERIAEFFSANHMRRHLMDIFVPDYTPNEDELAEEWERIKEANADARILELSYIFNTDHTQIQAAYDLSSEMDFADLAEFSTVGVSTATQDEFDQLFHLDFPEHNAIMNMQLGDIFPMDVPSRGGFVLVYASGETLPEWDELEPMFREDFIMQRRAFLFNEILLNWIEEADIRLNMRVINAF